MSGRQEGVSSCVSGRQDGVCYLCESEAGRRVVPVSVEVNHSFVRCFSDELLLELLVALTTANTQRDVHAAATRRVHWTTAAHRHDGFSM